MQIGARLSFDRLEDLTPRLEAAFYPIELALPYHWDIYRPIRARLDEVIKIIVDSGVEVLSVHGVQIPMDRDSFLDVAQENLKVAKEVGAKSIVFHPSKGQDSHSLVHYSTIKTIAQSYGVTATVETFSGKRCPAIMDLFIDKDILITIDLSHIPLDTASYMATHCSDRIISLHFSHREGRSQHQPFTQEEIKVLNTLRWFKWNGDIILEYLPEHHHLYSLEIERLQNLLRC